MAMLCIQSCKKKHRSEIRPFSATKGLERKGLAFLRHWPVTDLEHTWSSWTPFVCGNHKEWRVEPTVVIQSSSGGHREIPSRMEEMRYVAVGQKPGTTVNTKIVVLDVRTYHHRLSPYMWNIYDSIIYPPFWLVSSFLVLKVLNFNGAWCWCWKKTSPTHGGFEVLELLKPKPFPRLWKS